MTLMLPLANIQQACDTSRPASAVCEDFCTSKCSFYNASDETGEPTNITVYRLTPNNVTGIQNKNTGNAPGDVSFFLGKKNITQQCAKNPASFGCFLDGDNIYGKFTVELDGRYGPYFECNPINVFAARQLRHTAPHRATPHTAPCCATPRHAAPRHAASRRTMLRHAAPRYAAAAPH